MIKILKSSFKFQTLAILSPIMILFSLKSTFDKHIAKDYAKLITFSKLRNLLHVTYR
jgi:hypothetical protein